MTNRGGSDMSDALRELAEAGWEGPSAAMERAGSSGAAGRQAGGSGASRRVGAAAGRGGSAGGGAKGGMHGLKATMAPVVGTVGVLLLVPAIWAVLVLGGAEVFAAERNDALSMAKAMLVCWPIAICLIAASGVMMYQVVRGRKVQPAQEVRRPAAKRQRPASPRVQR